MRRFMLVSAALVLAFAFVGGSASAQAAPTVTVTPSSGLVDGQSVSVTGSGWPASTSLALLECRVASGPSVTCFGQESGTTDSEGDFSTQYVVMNDACNASGVSCLLGVSLEDFSSPVLTILHFAVGPRPDLVIRRRSDGVLFFDDVYTTTPTPYGHTIVAARTWTFAVLLQNDGDAAGDMTVNATSVAAPFTTRYLFGYYDLTSFVTSGAGLTLPNMAPGASELLAVQFTAAPTIRPGRDSRYRRDGHLAAIRTSRRARPAASLPCRRSEWAPPSRAHSYSETGSSP